MTADSSLSCLRPSSYTPFAMNAPMKSMSLSSCAALILLTSLPLFSQDAAPSHAAGILASMPRAKRIGEVALSPDGSKVAYVADDKISVIPPTGGSAQTIALEDKLPLRDVAWSMDSKRIAFIADLPGDVPSAQVWIAAADGSSPTKHAELKGYVQTPRFSPDGSRLAVLFTENLPRIAGPLQPMTPLAGEIDEKVFEQRIATIDLNGDRLAQLTPADMYVYEYEWSPDEKSWAAIAAHGAGDANWYVARLYRIDSSSGETREIYKPKLQIADPRISPDGKNVAFIEGLMSDEGSTGGEVYLVPITGGAARNLTPGIKSSPSALSWSDSNHVTFAENIDGNSGFGSVSTKGGDAQTLWTGEEFIHPGGNFWMASTTNATTAMVRQSASVPPEVWAGPVGKWKQLTQLNDGVKPAWGESRNVHWMNGTQRVQGWLMFPKDYDAKQKFPLIVSVHGGPSAACSSRWDELFSGSLSASGYFVLCPNPRGSYGQGETFTQANVKDFGGGDYRDIMAGIDSLIKQYPIDPKRLGIRGHSYGGYMTMWAETQTHRFAAAVSGAGLSDWLSYYGLNDIDEWMIPFFGASVYDDPVVYAKSDPMHFVKDVQTPTLILVGDRDGEVPMEQSVEWWHALETYHVPAKLVVYANEGHVFVKPGDWKDYQLRTMEWFEEWFAKAK
jgi:dipeptidyl aminopeptidase/acylaminoacyl peptidase